MQIKHIFQIVFLKFPMSYYLWIYSCSNYVWTSTKHPLMNKHCLPINASCTMERKLHAESSNHIFMPILQFSAYGMCVENIFRTLNNKQSLHINLWKSYNTPTMYTFEYLTILCITHCSIIPFHQITRPLFHSDFPTLYIHTKTMHVSSARTHIHTFFSTPVYHEYFATDTTLTLISYVFY